MTNLFEQFLQWYYFDGLTLTKTFFALLPAMAFLICGMFQMIDGFLSGEKVVIKHHYNGSICDTNTIWDEDVWCNVFMLCVLGGVTALFFPFLMFIGFLPFVALLLVLIKNFFKND